MLSHQLKIEFKRALIYKRIMVWIAIILLPSLIRFPLIKDSYAFYRPIEVFQILISDYIPMLFPVFMILIYTNSFVNERKNDFILYTRTRIWMPTYVWSKAIVNAVLAFIVSFLLIFLPFVFAIYVEPSLSIVHFYPLENSTTVDYTFNQLLTYGTLTYGIVYASWVGLNGVIYSTLAFLLSLTIKNSFIAFSLPFIWYQVMNFVTGVLGVSYLSPISTIFPFNVVKNDLWTVIPPFAVLCLAILGICYYIYRNQHEWMN